MRSTTEVVHDHLQKRLKGDIETDIAENYAPEVVVLSGSGEFRGQRGVGLAAEELERLVGAAKFTYRQTVVAGDYGFLEWTAEGESVVCDGADSFVVKDGRIVMQTIHYSPRN